MVRTRGKRTYSGTLAFAEAATDLSSDLEDQTAVEPVGNDAQQLIVWAASLELEAVGLRRNSEILRQHVVESCEALNGVLEQIKERLGNASNKTETQKVNKDIMAKLRNIERQVEMSDADKIKELRSHIDSQHKQMMRKMDEILKKQTNLADTASRPTTRQARALDNSAVLETPRSVVAQNVPLGPPRTPKRPPLPQSFVGLQPSWSSSEPQSPQRTPLGSPKRPAVSQSLATMDRSWSSSAISQSQRVPSESPSPRRTRPAPPNPFAEIERAWSQHPEQSFPPEPLSPRRVHPAVSNSFALEWPLITDSQLPEKAPSGPPGNPVRSAFSQPSASAGRGWSAHSAPQRLPQLAGPVMAKTRPKPADFAMEPPQVRKSARLRGVGTNSSSEPASIPASKTATSSRRRSGY